MVNVTELMDKHSGAITTLLVGFFGLVISINQVYSAQRAHDQSLRAQGTQLAFELWETHANFIDETRLSGEKLKQEYSDIYWQKNKTVSRTDWTDKQDFMDASQRLRGRLLKLQALFSTLRVCIENQSCERETTCTLFKSSWQDTLSLLPTLENTFRQEEAFNNEVSAETIRASKRLRDQCHRV